MAAIWLTHDIDAVTTGWLQDIRARRGFCYGAWRHRRKWWATFERIMDEEEAYGFRSTFLFLPVKDAANADYIIDEVAPYIDTIRARGFELGLHRSLASIPIEVELARLPYRPRCVRYHHLVQRDPEELRRVGILVDGSREGIEPCVEHGIIQTGLHIHDTRYVRDRRMAPADAAREIARVLAERAVKPLTVVLWHNSMWSAKYNYGGVYRQLLAHAAGRFEGVDSAWIIEQHAKGASWLPAHGTAVGASVPSRASG